MIDQITFLALLVVSGIVGSILAHIIFFRVTGFEFTAGDAMVRTMWFAFGAIFVAINVLLAPW